MSTKCVPAAVFQVQRGHGGPGKRGLFISAVLAASIATLCACGAEPPTSDPPRRSVQGILGGTVDREHGAVMGLTTSSGFDGEPEFLCTATVIHVHDGYALLLTAAHCVVQSDADGSIQIPIQLTEPFRLAVSPGESIRSDLALERRYPVVYTVIAPGYDGYLGSPNDVALVAVSGAPADMPHLPALTATEDQLLAGQAVTLVGYGDTAAPTADDFGWRRSTAQSIAWLNDQFIGFDQSSGHGICSGDSGGPALVTVGGALAIAGVHSLAAGTTAGPCAKAATSTRIARFADFIAEGVQSLPGVPECDRCAAVAPGNTCDPALSCTGSCATYLACVRACETNGCLAACGSPVAYAAAREHQRTSCISSQCSEPCASTPGVTGDGSGASGAVGGAADAGESGAAGLLERSPSASPGSDSSGCAVSKARSADPRNEGLASWLVVLSVLFASRRKAKSHN